MERRVTPPTCWPPPTYKQTLKLNTTNIAQRLSSVTLCLKKENVDAAF